MGTAEELESLPLEALDERFEQALLASPASERADWFAAADRLRDGGADEQARARAVYWALRQSLRAGRVSDKPRFLAILRSGLQRNGEFEAFARMAAETADPHLRNVATVCMGQCAANQGRMSEADDRFRAVLTEVRGSGTRVERTAYAGLAQSFHLQGREFESLVLTRRVVELSGASEDPWEACVALQHLCGTLDVLGDFEGLASALDTLASSLAGVQVPWAWRMERYLCGMRAELALRQQDGEAAERHIEAMSRTVPENESELGSPAWLPLLEAHAALLREDVSACLAALASIDAPFDPRIPLLEMACRLHAGDIEEAAAKAGRVLALLEAGSEEWVGSARRVAFASEVGRALEAADGPGALVRRAYDLAATSALERIGELERCLRDLPELAAVTVEDLKALQGFRDRFTAQHAELLRHLTEFLLDDLRNDRMLFDGLSEDGEYLRVCAWCQRVLNLEGDWLPIGHFFLPDRRVPVSHAVCPPCMADVLQNLGGAHSL